VKNFVNQAAVFCVKKWAKTHLRPSEIGKNFPEVQPPDPRGKGREKKEDRGGKGEEREGERGGEKARGYSPSKNVCLSSPLQQT
jgi:hypothetical protein